MKNMLEMNNDELYNLMIEMEIKKREVKQRYDIVSKQPCTPDGVFETNYLCSIIEYCDKVIGYCKISLGLVTPKVVQDALKIVNGGE